MAVRANWTNLNITYFFATKYNKELTSSLSNEALILLSCLAFVIFLGLVGVVFDLTKFGDIEGIDYKEFEPHAEFKNGT